MFWDEKNETLKRDELESLQLKRLRKTVRQTLKVDFYRKRLSKAHIRIEDIRTLHDIEKIPFTKKQDLRGGVSFRFSRCAAE